MICPSCRKPYFFAVGDTIGKCKKCEKLAPISDIKYTNYHKNKYTNDNKFYARNLKTDPNMKWIFKQMDIHENDFILEIGCGVGDYCSELAKISYRTIGTDRSIDYAKNRFNLEFISMSGESICFKADTFDKIFCINVIEHLKYPEKLLSEIQRVLKRNGKLVLETANLNFFLHDYHFDETHLYEWTITEFKDLVSDYFEIMDAKKTSSMFKYYPYNLILTKVIKPDLTIICEKK